MKVRWAWLLAASTSGGACGAESSGAAAPPDAATTAPSTRTTVSFWGWLTELPSPGSPPPPAAGATVCVVEHPDTPCVTSDELGFYVLSGVPANARVTVSYVAPAHATTRLPLTTFAWDIPITMRLTANSTASAFANAAGFAYPDANAGYVILEAPPGTMATLTTAAGPVAGPFYSDGAGAPNPAATSVANGGFVAWARVPAGPVVLQFSPERPPCAFAAHGWDRTPTSIAGDVVAGAITLLGADCR